MKKNQAAVLQINLRAQQAGATSRGPISRLTSVLPFLTSSRRSNTSARLGSSESTNHMGGVDGYDSCNTGKSTTWKRLILVICGWISHKASKTADTFSQNQIDILGNEIYDRAPGLLVEEPYLLSRPPIVSLARKPTSVSFTSRWTQAEALLWLPLILRRTSAEWAKEPNQMWAKNAFSKTLGVAIPAFNSVKGEELGKCWTPTS